MRRVWILRKSWGCGAFEGGLKALWGWRTAMKKERAGLGFLGGVGYKSGARTTVRVLTKKEFIMTQEMISALQKALAQGAKSFDFGAQAQAAVAEARVRSAYALPLAK
jgi:hypothetical protein